ncbi:MAG TPA: hypothetical protein VIK95_06210 [Egibacteraceae bacterium]
MTTTAIAARSLAAFAASAVATVRLLARQRLRAPRDQVGRRVAFADGSASQVYRETARVGAIADPVVLLVCFRLRLAGRSRLLHAAFRVESLVHTPLFAGFPGFGTKLWLTDTGTGVYRGLYEWDGEARARAYAETLCRLLRLVSEPGSVAFHVLPGRRRDEVLATAHARPGPWWEVAA